MMTVRVRRDSSYIDEITEFDDDGLMTEVINPLPATVRWLNELQARLIINVEEA